MLHALVSLKVARKLSPPCGIPGTEVALVRSLAGVDAHVRGQVAFTIEGLAAVFAFKWTCACMYYLVSPQGKFFLCSIVTRRTLEHSLFCGTFLRNWLAGAMT